jgi:hypothetical protein
VCIAHGGASQQVRRRAQERLAALVDPAITELAKLIRDADGDSVKLAAIRDVLDRAGYKAADKLEQASSVEITVRYADDIGIVPAPGRATGRRNGQQALSGPQDHSQD